MALMAWDESMSVGIPSIDKQHQKLVAMLNKLYEGMTTGKSRETLGHVLDELSAYTVEHFKHEETLFAMTKYPEAAAHKKEHDDLMAQVQSIVERFRGGASGVLSLEVFNFLKRWLTNHIQGVDKKYAPHLKQHGAS